MHLVTRVLLPLFINGMLLVMGQSDTSKLQQTIGDLRHEQNSTTLLLASLSAELHSIKTEMRFRESELANVESDIKKLKEENTMLRHILNSTSGDCDVNSTSGLLHDLNTDVIVLNGDVKSIKDKLDQNNFEAAYSSMNSILSEANKTSEEISSVRAELVDLKSDLITSVANETSDLKRNLTNMLQRLELMETAHVNNPGSSTAQTTSIFYQVHLNPDITVQSNGVLIFDTVTANVGNGYDVKTGVFTAPVEGKYLLWANVLAQSQTNAVLDVFLYKNDHSVGAAYSKVPYMMGYNTASITTIVPLKAGDQIHYRLLTTIMITGKQYSNYGGVLLP